MPPRSLVLASASPARLALLRAAGLAPHVMASGVEEDGVEGLTADDAARALAARKADAVAAQFAATTDPATLVVGCDSMLSIDGQVRGRPASADQARDWWRTQRARSGILVTGHAVVDTATGRRACAVARTVMRFGAPSDDELDAYIATGEPLAVAGACTIDGYGAPFVDGIDGDHGTVLGLSMPLLRRLLGELGVAITDLWVATP